MNDYQPHKSLFLRLLQALHRNPHDREELVEVLHMAKEKQILNSDALIMIEGVLNVSQTQVRDIMVPRGRMVVIECDDTPEALVAKVIESTHSRFPVIGENRDEVLGILLAKDLLRYYQHATPAMESEPRSIQTWIRPAVFVPESKRLDILLREFRINRYHMAIVVDEYGGVSGLVTIEDVLEQIVGNIEDETDVATDGPPIKKIDEVTFDIKPLTLITDFNEYFGMHLTSEECDTIGGYVTQEMGHIPKRGEECDLGSGKLVVVSATKRCIQQLQFLIHPTA